METKVRKTGNSPGLTLYNQLTEDFILLKIDTPDH